MSIDRRFFCLFAISFTGALGCNCATSVARTDGAVDARFDGEAGRVDVPEIVPPDVRVVITADNAYAFGWGDANSVTTLRGRPMFNMCNGYICATDLFDCPIGTGAAGAGPEEYVVPGREAPADGYLYIVAWEDLIGTQGVIGQFERAGATVSTGTPDWEVCATGVLFNAAMTAEAAGPSQALVNTEITRCNAGLGERPSTSAGWVNTAGAVTTNAIGKLRLGERNDSAHEVGTPIVGDNAFPIVCQMSGATGGVSSSARWMWYSVNDSDNAFVYPSPAPTERNYSRQFLIFRLPVNTIIP